MLLFLFFIYVAKTGTDTDTAQNKEKCPSVAEMEDSLNLYRTGKIIYKFEPKLNAVYITPLAEKQLLYDDLRVLGYITACYSSYVKGNDLRWVDIYSAKTNKKIAEYSETWGFKTY